MTTVLLGPAGGANADFTIQDITALESIAMS